MDSLDSDHSCRICRGESTPDAPLLHPCKCKGSIRYIHQDCLQEWLDHSHKALCMCDICNTPYSFRTIYDPNMPPRIPFSLVLARAAAAVRAAALKTLSVLLYFVCIFLQVPACYMFVSRICTWTIDGHLPVNNPAPVMALFFGDVNVGPSPTVASLANRFFYYTYTSGLVYLATTVIVIFALFVEHEWVVHDEGYLKLLKKTMGMRPKPSFRQLLQETLQMGTGGDDRMVHALTQFQDELDGSMIEDADGPAVNTNAALGLRESLHRILDEPDIGVDADYDAGDESDRRAHVAPDADNNNTRDRPAPLPRFPEGPRHVPPPDVLQVPVFPGLDAAREVAPPHNDLPPDVFDDQMLNEPENGGFGRMMEEFGIRLDVLAPISLMIMIDLIIAVVLFLVYFIPHSIGNIIATVVGMVAKFLYHLAGVAAAALSARFVWIQHMVAAVSAATISAHVHPSLSFAGSLVLRDFILPFALLLRNIYIEKSSPQYTAYERLAILIIGYAEIASDVARLMRLLLSSKSLQGTSLQVFRALFEIRATAKVFAIFSTEIFFFAVFCGWLLDLCLAPFVLPSFLVQRDGQSHLALLATGVSSYSQIPCVRIFLYWTMGTLYMLMFSLFINMIRSLIMRPGVLYFIRSPNDPNTRLIHDALMKPFTLQISRIWLSAKMYTAFILVGVGSVTWSLRYAALAFPHYNPFPVLGLLLNDMVPLSLGALLALNQSAGAWHFERFWRHAIEISAHKLRLSHFILGKPIAQERGYVVYRSWWHMLSGRAVPDYLSPVSYREAQALFVENAAVTACFVPNGNHTRAPAKDTVTRAFLKKMFVPVTKDDILWPVSEASAEAPPPRPNYETPTSLDDSDELNIDNAYQVVYRPPHFQTRCVLFVIMLWMFGTALLLGAAAATIVCGLPIVFVMQQLGKFIPITLFYTAHVGLSSFMYGVPVFLILLEYLKKWQANVNAPGAAVVDDIQADHGLNDDLLDQVYTIVRTELSFSRALYLWLLWTAYVHVFCVQLPLQHWYADKGILPLVTVHQVLRQQTITYTPPIVATHLVASLFTFVPTVRAFAAYMYSRGGHLALPQILDKTEYSAVRLRHRRVTLCSIVLLLLCTFVPYGHFNFVVAPPFVFVLFMADQILVRLLRLYNFFAETVKDEVYAQGRAIENIDS